MTKVIACGFTCLLLFGCASTRQSAHSADNWEPAQKKDIRVSLIKTLIDAKAYTSSVPLLRKALTDSPNDPRLHFLMGSVLRERSLYQQAVQSFERAVELEPKFGQAYSGLAITLNMMDKHEAALLMHQKAVQVSGNAPKLLNNLGFGLSLLGKHSAAVMSYRQALGLDPNLRSAYVNLGFSLGITGDVKGAESAFSQVLKRAEVLNNLALIKEIKGEREGAIELYKKALTASPDMLVAQENLEAAEAELQQR